MRPCACAASAHRHSNWRLKATASPGRFLARLSQAQIIAAYQLPGSNAVDAAAGVKKLMAQMKERFPEDMDFAISLDTTLSVTQGIKEIVWTLLIALVLVIIVVFLFLQGWRSTLIPLLAVPVSLVGTFVLFPLFGFSINTLSLFGLVLAIGLVVDDAIVVVEGVERHIEEGMTPKDAALKAMEELSGPGRWNCPGSVPLYSCPPPSFQGSGRLYQQFAVTIAISVKLLSADSTLDAQPCSGRIASSTARRAMAHCGKFFCDWFNRVFERATEGYVSSSKATCCSRRLP